MPILSTASRFSPEVRASLYHFTVYFTSGASAAYFGVWMAGRGITPGEIGIVNAVPIFALLLINYYIGRIADRAGDWRQVIIWLSVLAAVTPFGLFFVSGFAGVAIVWTLVIIPSGSIPPVVDAATLRMTERRGTSFGNIRGWGTLGCMVATGLTDGLAALFGSVAFVPVVVATALVRAVLSLQIPRFRAPGRQPTVAAALPGAKRLREVLQPWFVLPLVGFALVQSTHFILNAFAALTWKEQGVPDWLLGLIIGTSQVGEATVMFVWRRLGLRVSARQMILASGIAAILRWSVVAMSPPVWVLFLAQLLHAFTFAVGYLGTIHFIANWTSEDIAAEAQGFSFILQQGMGVVALVLFGWLFGLFGAPAFFAPAALGLAGVICVLISVRLQPPRHAALAAA